MLIVIAHEMNSRAPSRRRVRFVALVATFALRVCRVSSDKTIYVIFKILHQIDLELASVTILFICFITNSEKKTFTSDTFFFQLKKNNPAKKLSGSITHVRISLITFHSLCTLSTNIRKGQLTKRKLKQSPIGGSRFYDKRNEMI